MTELESALVNSLNSYYSNNKIKAVAYRLYQAQYSRGQNVDIVSDSLNKKYYLAIEAKSMNATKAGTFNFKSRFDYTGGGFQLQREILFCRKTGRTGILALELRLGMGKSRECYFIPLEFAYKEWKNGEKSIKLDYITDNFPKINREGGKYILKNDIIIPSKTINTGHTK